MLSPPVIDIVGSTEPSELQHELGTSQASQLYDTGLRHQWDAEEYLDTTSSDSETCFQAIVAHLGVGKTTQGLPPDAGSALNTEADMAAGPPAQHLSKPPVDRAKLFTQQAEQQARRSFIEQMSRPSMQPRPCYGRRCGSGFAPGQLRSRIHDSEPLLANAFDAILREAKTNDKVVPTTHKPAVDDGEATKPAALDADEVKLGDQVVTTTHKQAKDDGEATKSDAHERKLDDEVGITTYQHAEATKSNIADERHMFDKVVQAKNQGDETKAELSLPEGDETKAELSLPKGDETKAELSLPKDETKAELPLPKGDETRAVLSLTKGEETKAELSLPKCDEKKAELSLPKGHETMAELPPPQGDVTKAELSLPKCDETMAEFSLPMGDETEDPGVARSAKAAKHRAKRLRRQVTCEQGHRMKKVFRQGEWCDECGDTFDVQTPVWSCREEACNYGICVPCLVERGGSCRSSQ